jgi:hypothetical protein
MEWHDKRTDTFLKTTASSKVFLPASSSRTDKKGDASENNGLDKEWR